MSSSDESSSYTSSSGDAEAMKDYIRSISPTKSPGQAGASSGSPRPSKPSFDNLFSDAGLSDNSSSSQPSKANTSVSLESQGSRPNSESRSSGSYSGSRSRSEGSRSSSFSGSNSRSEGSRSHTEGSQSENSKGSNSPGRSGDEEDEFSGDHTGSYSGESRSSDSRRSATEGSASESPSNLGSPKNSPNTPSEGSAWSSGSRSSSGSTPMSQQSFSHNSQGNSHSRSSGTQSSAVEPIGGQHSTPSPSEASPAKSLSPSNASPAKSLFSSKTSPERALSPNKASSRTNSSPVQSNQSNSFASARSTPSVKEEEIKAESSPKSSYASAKSHQTSRESTISQAESSPLVPGSPPVKNLDKEPAQPPSPVKSVKSSTGRQSSPSKSQSRSPRLRIETKEQLDRGAANDISTEGQGGINIHEKSHTETELSSPVGKQMTVLQRLEARRRALQASMGSASRSSSGVLASKDTEEKTTESEKSEEKSSKESVPVNEIQMNHVKDTDSKTDYDPRTDEREEWKVLMQRSTIGKNQSGSSGEKSMRDARDGKGWMPPALTTYGEQKYSPEDEVVDYERLDPPSSKVRLQEFKKRPILQAKSERQKVAELPIQEIEVTPPPEDESSLGSMGHLFPKVAPAPETQHSAELASSKGRTPASPRQGADLVSHKMKPTVGGVDYDYYRSWILPGVRAPPRPKSTIIMESDKADPPGDATEFKPTRAVKTAYTPPESQPTTQVIERSPPPESNPSDPVTQDTPTWAPSRPTHDPRLGQPVDEWERWRLTRLADEVSADSSSKHSFRSYASSTSDWAPPGKLRRPTSTPKSNDKSERESAGSTWIPPTRVARLDYAGAVSSQEAPRSTPRAAYKKPREYSESEQSSSYTPSSSRMSRSTNVDPVRHPTTTKSQRGRVGSAPRQTVGPASRNRNNGSKVYRKESPSSESSSSKSSSEDTGAIFDAQIKQTHSPRVVTSSGQSGSDVEHGSQEDTRTRGEASSKPITKGYPRPVVCTCIFLAFVAVGGAIAAVVLILGDFLPSTESSTKTSVGDTTFSPAQMPSLAPVAVSPVPMPTLPPILFNPTAPSSPVLPPSSPIGNQDFTSDPLYELITTRYPAGASALSDPASPQSKAFQWLRSPTNSEVTSTLKSLQRYALASLYYSTGGPAWSSASAWLSAGDECSWGTTASSGSMCDSKGNLVELSLQNNNLKGELPGELILLWNSLGMYAQAPV